MATIITMNSKEFLDDFIEKFNYKKYNFLLVSQDITTNKKYGNVYATPSIMPPPNVLSELIGKGDPDKYEKKYIKYLSDPKVDSLITVLVKLATVDNSNVILLCSKEEDDYGYLDILRDYIEATYSAKVYSYKKYKKKPDKCDSVGKNKKKIVKILTRKLKEVDTSAEPTVNKSDIKDRLKQLSKKELVAFAKSKGLKLDKDGSKSDMIKVMLKKLF